MASKGMITAKLQVLQGSRETDTDLSHNFGIVTIQAGKCGVRHESLGLGFNVDRSASMETRAEDGRSKIEHAKYTLTRMVSYLSEKEMGSCGIRVGVNTFDHENKPLTRRSNASSPAENNMWFPLDSEASRDELLRGIGSIETRGSTNIGGACGLMKRKLDGVAQGGEHWAHVLLTDGHPNVGEKSAPGILAECPTDVDNYFVGYGADHNGALLQKLASLAGGEYHFVESYENAGMVYGEILHGILFKAVHDVSLAVEGAELYDFRENKWTNRLPLPSLASEQSRTYHFRFPWDSKDALRIVCEYKETNSDEVACVRRTSFPYSSTATARREARNLEVHKYWYRQQTLELLHACQRLCATHGYSAEFQEAARLLRNHLSEFLERMKAFMKKNNLDDDAFMMKLADDVYVSHESVGREHGYKFVTSRQTSQGDERAYAACNLGSLGCGGIWCGAAGDVAPRPVPLSRNTAGGCGNLATAPPAPSLNHQMSQDVTTCYGLPEQVSLMRAVTRHSSDKKKEAETL